MTYRIAEELRATDELCRRWARFAWDWPVWGASPIYRGMRQRAGHMVANVAAAPMPDDVEALARIIADSHGKVFALLSVWYCHGGTSDTKAKRLGISRRSIYYHHEATLIYLRARLRARGWKL